MRTITKGPRFAADTDSVLQVVDTGYVRTGIALSTPSPEWLARNGFILPRTSSEELPKYFAPTPEVLISEPFTSTHCFRGMQHPDSSWLGLAFEPAKGIVMPDVRGVVWVDTLRARPVRIEYHYTRLAEFLDKHERRYARRPGETDREYQRGIEREQTWVTEKVAVPGTRIFAPDPKEDEFGGIIEFEQTHDRWDISRWEIRWPSLRYRSRYAFSEPVPGQGLVNGRTVVRRYVVNIWFHILLHWNVAEIVQE
jgi:hypothetical protein